MNIGSLTGLKILKISNPPKCYNPIYIGAIHSEPREMKTGSGENYPGLFPPEKSGDCPYPFPINRKMEVRLDTEVNFRMRKNLITFFCRFKYT
jgi:hypothetical protein